MINAKMYLNIRILWDTWKEWFCWGI